MGNFSTFLGAAMMMGMMGGGGMPGSMPASRKPERPCIRCGKMHTHNNSFCSSECCKNWTAERKTTKEKILSIINCPSHWSAAEPNDRARHNAFLLTTWASTHVNIQPTTIAASIEGGIYVSYRQDQKELIFESYNDGRSAVVITKNKEIVYSKDIVYKTHFIDACKLFCTL